MAGQRVDDLEGVQWAIIVLQIIALLYFNYYMIKYNKQFSLIKQSPLILASFIFVELTLASKLLLRTVSIISIRIESNKELEEYLSENRGSSALVCTYDLAFPIGITTFTVALTLSAVRWVYQIIILQNGYESKSLNKPTLITLTVLFSLIVSSVSILYMAHQCKGQEASNESSFFISKLLFTLVTQILNLVALILFSYACAMNQKYTNNQIKMEFDYLDPKQIILMRKNAK